MMGNTAVWTAAHYRIPILFVVANNRSFYNDEVHQERVARMPASGRSTTSGSASASAIRTSTSPHGRSRPGRHRLRAVLATPASLRRCSTRPSRRSKMAASPWSMRAILGGYSSGDGRAPMARGKADRGN